MWNEDWGSGRGTFRDSDDDDRDGGHEGLDDLVEWLVAESAVVAEGYSDSEVDEKSDHGERGGNSSDETDLVGDGFEFLLERGGLINFLKLFSDFSEVRVIANGSNENLSASVHHYCLLF